MNNHAKPHARLALFHTAPSTMGLAAITAMTALTAALAISPPTMAQEKKPSVVSEDTSHLLIPVARINPDQPLSVTIINDTAIPLEYGLSTNNIAPQELAAGGEAVLDAVPMPTGLLINAFTSAAVLDYAVETVEGDNALIVTVSLVDQLYDASGFTAIDIHETGAIYRY